MFSAAGQRELLRSDWSMAAATSDGWHGGVRSPEAARTLPEQAALPAVTSELGRQGAAPNTQVDQVSSAPSGPDLVSTQEAGRREAAWHPRDRSESFSIFTACVNRLADALDAADGLGNERTSRGKLGRAYTEAVSLASWWGRHIQLGEGPLPTEEEADDWAARAAKATSRLGKAVRLATRPSRGSSTA